MNIELKQNLITRLIILLLAGVLVNSTPTQAQQNLNKDITFVSWTGPYMRSQILGFVRPYEVLTNTTINVVHYAGGIDEIRDQVESANVIWDVVDLTQADSLRACQEGLLEKLDTIQLPDGHDGTNFRDDFTKGAINECGIGVIEWATAYAFNHKMFAKNTPKTIADFFDTKKFPGARAIRNDPSVIMEWALIADGVPVDEVYAQLETPQGIARALDKMQSIKPGLQFWTKGKEPIMLLNNEEVAMSMVWATTGATSSKLPGANFTMVWSGRVIEMDLFGIPKGAPNKQAAIEFIRFASSSESLAKMASFLPNGPTRTSSLKLLPNEILVQLPNGPAYEDKISIRSNAQWWSKNYTKLKDAFDVWLSTPAQHGAAGTVR